MAEEEILEIDITDFFPLEEQKEIDEIQMRLRRIISTLKSYFNSIGSDIDSFSSADFERSVKELDRAQQIYHMSRKMETARQLEITSSEITMNDLCVQISDQVNRIASIDQCMVQYKMIMEQNQTERESLSETIESMEHQIENHKELLDQLSSYHKASTDSLNEPKHDYAGDIRSIREKIPELEKTIKMTKASIEALLTRLKDTSSAKQKAQKKLNGRQETKKKLKKKIAENVNELMQDIKTQSLQREKEQDREKARRTAIDELKARIKELTKACQQKDSDMAGLKQRQTEKTQGSSVLENTLRETRKMAEETKGETSRLTDIIEQKLKESSSHIQELKDQQMSVSNELSSYKKRLATQKQQKAESKKSIEALYEIRAIRERELELIDSSENLGKEYETLKNTEIEVTEMEKIEALKEKQKASHATIMSSIDFENKEIERLKTMIASFEARNDRVQERINRTQKDIDDALRINPALYSPANPKPVGKKYRKQIIKDVKERSQVRADQNAQIKRDIVNTQDKIAALQQSFGPKREKLAEKRQFLDEYEMRAEIETDFSLSERQRTVLKSILSLTNSIRHEFKVWQTADGFQVPGLLSSWEIVVNSTTTDLKQKGR